MNQPAAPTRTGAERVRADPSLVGGDRIGLVTNYTGVLPDLRTTVASLREAGVALTALFGPEHGLRGTTQAGKSEPDDLDGESGLPLFDTYRHSGADLDALVASSGVDTLLYDLQDIGTRFYTYVWTMYDLLASAARTGVRFVVLDRPNPIGGLAAEGPLLDVAAASFVGRASIPIRHGLTVGELARHFNAEAIPAEAGRPAELDVVGLTGWRRSHFADQTGLPWVMPSVNMPTLDSALAYSGTGLFEGTNLSEGRGTTRPFELIGAPYVDARLARKLNEQRLPGVRFRDVSFAPTFHKYAGRTVRGVQLHVHDREAFAPVSTTLAMLYSLRVLYPDDFAWRDRAADAGAEHSGPRHAVDLLWGGDSLRLGLDARRDPAELLEAAGVSCPADWVGADALLYD
ncbi:MAG: exo-beta-N-acetylmuramidase NamZ family protein [Stackebrandtia sp.]